MPSFYFLLLLRRFHFFHIIPLPFLFFFRLLLFPFFASSIFRRPLILLICHLFLQIHDLLEDGFLNYLLPSQSLHLIKLLLLLRFLSVMPCFLPSFPLLLALPLHPSSYSTLPSS